LRAAGAYDIIKSFLTERIDIHLEKIAMVSLGCPKNRVDSEIILGLLGEKGYRITEDEKQADIVIINTCTFIQKATDESIETILEYAALKETGTCRLLIVAGCLTQRYQEKLKKELPEVDLFVGTGEYQRIADLVIDTKMGMRPLEAKNTEYIHDHETPRLVTTPFYYSYVKIAEGCSNPCTFCIIPQLRGDYRSREIYSVTEEVRKLASKGVKEFNIVAQDTTAYGRDLASPQSLEKLLREMVKISDAYWIRLLYCYPTLLTEGLLDLIASKNSILNYIDLPLQHIDDNILKAMKRGTREEMVKKLTIKIKDKIPDVAIRSAFIVGFPGEGEREFENLFNFIKETEFDHLGIFKYSREEGTAAASMSGQVPDDLKEERFRKLMELQQEISLKKNMARIGKKIKVLIEGYSSETDLLLEGRAAFQAPEIDGITYINDGYAEQGEIRDVLITEALPYDLVGKIVDSGADDVFPPKGQDMPAISL